MTRCNLKYGTCALCIRLGLTISRKAFTNFLRKCSASWCRKYGCLSEMQLSSCIVIGRSACPRMPCHNLSLRIMVSSPIPGLSTYSCVWCANCSYVLNFYSVLCGEASHVPFRCEEVEKDKKETSGRLTVEEAISAAKIRHCPKCRKPFIKSDGW
jgi:hypothetical protein